MIAAAATAAKTSNNFRGEIVLSPLIMLWKTYKIIIHYYRKIKSSAKGVGCPENKCLI
jgi:hypothetical protein